MSGERGHLGSKPAREIFLTSSSLSFSSLSSSCTSWDDAKESRTSCEGKGKLPNASSQASGLTHARMQPAPSPPSRLPPVQLMNKGYDPERISASVFGKTGDGNWSEFSNDSLFSLKVDAHRISNGEAFRISNLRPGEVLMSGEFLSYSPSLLVKPEDAQEKKISQVQEIKNGLRSVETDNNQDKSSSTPVVSDQAPPTNIHSLSLPVGEKKSKSKKKNKKRKSKKKKKKKKKNKCCMWMWCWLCSGFSKCGCCYNWIKCCCYRGPKATVLDASS